MVHCLAESFFYGILMREDKREDGKGMKERKLLWKSRGKKKRIAMFHKVSKERFAEDFCSVFTTYTSQQACTIYETLKLPKRATKSSAGYDFYAPVTFTLQPKESLKVPTGIRVEMREGWVLQCYPRSGLGFKYRLQLDNTVGIIDSDYFDAENEGHIFVKITNDSKEGKSVTIEEGKGFCQGIFMEYGITVDDEADGIRLGGLGSTTPT